jgi:hypothetical protein
MGKCILDLSTKWRWSPSHSGCFTPRERAPGIHWIGGWVGPRVALDMVVKRKFLAPARTVTPDHPACRYYKLVFLAAFSNHVVRFESIMAVKIHVQSFGL